jgi:urease accessory protein
MLRRLPISLLLILAATAPAFAHLDPVVHGSFAAGFTHPLFGLDHILAMVAVGLWAASVGGRAIVAVPTAFVGTMAIGFVAALFGMPLPLVEPVILASVIFIGIMVALALPLPSIAVGGVVAFFALFHGHAHGEEMGAAGAFQYGLGFVAATVLLHASGIAIALGAMRIVHTSGGKLVTRVGGSITALGGLWLALAG